MNSVLHGLWLSSLLVFVVLLGQHTPGLPSRSHAAAARQEAPLVDASGQRFEPADYRRIASGSSLGDAVLLALAEPERIVALSAYGRGHSDAPHLYGQRTLLSNMQNLERLFALRADLLLVNHIGSQAELARAREAGITLFNLGDMRGLDSLIPNIHAVARLLGDPARGELYATKLLRRMHAVASDIPGASRKTAAYVASYGGKLLGGALGTSYHDVLTSAGLIDVAARTYRGFPQYDPEQLLSLNPELIITSQGLGAGLCAVSGMDRLRACQNGRTGVVELPEDLLADPGPRMLDAAEALRDRVYGRPGARPR